MMSSYGREARNDQSNRRIYSLVQNVLLKGKRKYKYVGRDAGKSDFGKA